MQVFSSRNFTRTIERILPENTDCTQENFVISVRHGKWILWDLQIFGDANYTKNEI